MPNLYGVANPVINLAYVDTIGTANVTCTAGIETNVFQSGAITALDRGIYVPICIATIVLSFGATASTGLTFGLRINSGADLTSMTGNIPVGAANTAQTWPFAAVGPALPTSFWPPGSNIQVSVLVAGQNATCNVGYSKCIIGILRAADQ